MPHLPDTSHLQMAYKPPTDTGSTEYGAYPEPASTLYTPSVSHRQGYDSTVRHAAWPKPPPPPPPTPGKHQRPHDFACDVTDLPAIHWCSPGGRGLGCAACHTVESYPESTRQVVTHSQQLRRGHSNRCISVLQVLQMLKINCLLFVAQFSKPNTIQNFTATVVISFA